MAKIGEWETLCEYLGVQKAILNNLRDMNTENTAKKHKCLEAYIDTGKACWETVVEIITEYPFYRKKLAEEIANMHCYSKDEL